MLVYKLFEFAVQWIPLIRNKAVLSSVKKIHLYIAIADKKIKSLFCVPGGEPQPAVQIK